MPPMLEAGTVPAPVASPGVAAPLTDAAATSASRVLRPGERYAHLSPMERMQHAIRMVTQRLTGGETAKLIASRVLKTHVQPQVIAQMIADITPALLLHIVEADEFLEKVGAPLASRHSLLGRFVEAEALVDAELHKEPDSMESLALKAHIQLSTDRLAEAKTTAEKALALDLDAHKFRLMLAQVHLLEGDLQAAHRELRELSDRGAAPTPTRLMVEALADFPVPGAALAELMNDEEETASLVFLVMAKQGNVKEALKWLGKAAQSELDMNLAAALQSPFVGQLGAPLALLREQIARIGAGPAPGLPAAA